MSGVTYIALLRAINLAGKRTVAMSALRELVTGLGLADVRSLLQSGNLVFRAPAQPNADLESLLEAAAAASLGLETDFFVRTVPELESAIRANPFPEAATNDPGHLVLMLLKHSPEPEAVTNLQAAIPGREAVSAFANHLHVTYPDGIGRSKLTVAVIERRLGTRATGRNWNTVLKLADAARG